jgi:hypothetical protein
VVDEVRRFLLEGREEMSRIRRDLDAAGRKLDQAEKDLKTPRPTPADR